MYDDSSDIASILGTLAICGAVGLLGVAATSGPKIQIYGTSNPVVTVTEVKWSGNAGSNVMLFRDGTRIEYVTIPENCVAKAEALKGKSFKTSSSNVTYSNDVTVHRYPDIEGAVCTSTAKLDLL